MVFEPKLMATTVQGQNSDSSSHLWKSAYQKLDQLIMSAFLDKFCSLNLMVIKRGK